MEGEYVAMSICARELLWTIEVRRFLGITREDHETLMYFSDSQGAIKLATQKGMITDRSKHISVI